MLAFWKRLRENQESSNTERKTIVTFVTHIKYMLWWFSNVTDILKIIEWFVLRMDTYREHESFEKARRILFSFPLSSP